MSSGRSAVLCPPHTRPCACQWALVGTAQLCRVPGWGMSMVCRGATWWRVRKAAWGLCPPRPSSCSPGACPYSLCPLCLLFSVSPNISYRLLHPILHTASPLLPLLVSTPHSRMSGASSRPGNSSLFVQVTLQGVSSLTAIPKIPLNLQSLA